MVTESDLPAPGDLTPREPRLEDLVQLCRHLNQSGARYLVIGGFAVRAVGYVRQTMDIDLLVAGDEANEQRVYQALQHLPDGAVRELQPGELAKYEVIRVADEIVVDLMTSASGIDYAQAAADVNVVAVNGVPIPFASPQLLWRMKSTTHRAKDEADRLFLREWFASHNLTPPA